MNWEMNRNALINTLTKNSVMEINSMHIEYLQYIVKQPYSKSVAVFSIHCSNVPAAVASHLDSC